MFERKWVTSNTEASRTDEVVPCELLKGKRFDMRPVSRFGYNRSRLQELAPSLYRHRNFAGLLRNRQRPPAPGSTTAMTGGYQK